MPAEFTKPYVLFYKQKKELNNEDCLRKLSILMIKGFFTGKKDISCKFHVISIGCNQKVAGRMTLTVVLIMT